MTRQATMKYVKTDEGGRYTVCRGSVSFRCRNALLNGFALFTPFRFGAVHDLDPRRYAALTAGSGLQQQHKKAGAGRPFAFRTMDYVRRRTERVAPEADSRSCDAQVSQTLGAVHKASTAALNQPNTDRFTDCFLNPNIQWGSPAQAPFASLVNLEGERRELQTRIDRCFRTVCSCDASRVRRWWRRGRFIRRATQQRGRLRLRNGFIHRRVSRPTPSTPAPGLCREPQAVPLRRGFFPRPAPSIPRAGSPMW